MREAMAKLPQEDLFESTSMTFGEHLEELRVSLMRALLGLGLGMLIGFLIANRVVKWIEIPLVTALNQHYSLTAEERLAEQYGAEVSEEMAEMAAAESLLFEDVYVEWNELRRLASQVGDPGEGVELQPPTTDLDQELPPPSTHFVKTRFWRRADAKITVLSPQEAFMIWLKAAAVSGLIISSPYMFFQIWLFVAAGLYPHEKRYVHIFLPFSIGLFLAGAALAVFFVFGPVLQFLFGFARWMDIDPDLRISEVISFVLILPLGFGVAFQLPLVMLFINRIGIASVSAYLQKWRIAILVIFVIAMLLTPADPVSMLLMACPLTGLYFLGIALCQWMPKGRNPFDEAYEPS
jgi:sec-independent protein translocase protein TatC